MEPYLTFVLALALSYIPAQFYFHHPSHKKIKIKISFYNLLLQSWVSHLSFIKAKVFSETNIQAQAEKSGASRLKNEK